MTLKLNVSYSSLEDWYEYYGSSWYQDIAFICFLPCGLFGFMLNLLVYKILKNKQFVLPIYTYLRWYTLCSAAVCLVFATKFVQSTRQLLGFTNSAAAFWYASKILVPIITILNLYGAFLDVVLSLDRVILFSKNNQKIFFTKLNPNKLSIYLLLISFLFQFPVWFYYEPFEHNIPLNETFNFTMHYLNRSEFGNSLYANILIIVHHLIADVLPVFLQNVINIVTIVRLRRYLKRKSKLLNSKCNKIEKEEAVLVNPNLKVSVKKEKKKLKSNQIEDRLTIMVIILSTLSTM
jgi:hypothetical protein